MVTIDAITPLDELAYLVSVTSDEPLPIPFRLLVDGVLAGEITSPVATAEFRVTITPNTDPLIEVLDRPLTRPTLAFSGNVILAWDEVSGAALYRVEQEIASVWTALATIVDDGRPVFTFQTPWLADGGIYPFRIVPVSAAGNDGPAITRSVAQIRQPPAPNVTYTYSAATEKVTIAST